MNLSARAAKGTRNGRGTAGTPGGPTASAGLRH
jgi:hypothetical protein